VVWRFKGRESKSARLNDDRQDAALTYVSHEPEELVVPSGSPLAQPLQFLCYRRSLGTRAGPILQVSLELGETPFNREFNRLSHPRKDIAHGDPEDDLISESHQERRQRRKLLVTRNRAVTVIAKDFPQFILAEPGFPAVNAQVIYERLIRLFSGKELCHATFFFKSSNQNCEQKTGEFNRGA
jgi:hypothetical protein